MGSRKETKSVGSQVEDARDEVSDDANDDDPLRRLSPIDLVNRRNKTRPTSRSACSARR